MNDRFLKLKDVCRMTALSPATIYRMIAADEFPQQIKIGAAGKNGAVVWSESSVLRWMEGFKLVAAMKRIDAALDGPSSSDGDYLAAARSYLVRAASERG